MINTPKGSQTDLNIGTVDSPKRESPLFEYCECPILLKISWTIDGAFKKGPRKRELW